MNNVLKVVASHAGTKRARRAFLEFVPSEGQKDASNSRGIRAQFVNAKEQQLSSRKQRVLESSSFLEEESFTREPLLRLPVAESVEEARYQYDLVAQAILLVQQESSNDKKMGTDSIPGLTIPPFYGADSGPFDTKNLADTDDDEWLDCPVSEWTLEDVLKADQVVQMLLRVHEWGQGTQVQTWAPYLAEMTQHINATVLTELNREITNAVEIKRVKTATDPMGRSAYFFSLRSESFPVLRLLREKEQELGKRKAGRPNDQKLADLREEIVERENSIQLGLVAIIAKYRQEIDKGLSVVAHLDMAMAKAAFAVRQSGVIPIVKEEGTISVHGFCHPLLPRGIPVDLHLASNDNKNGRALIISGPNGGGKTLAMKSFGLAAVFVRLGIPLPLSLGSTVPRVDFFNSIYTCIGDLQNVEDGQSTFMGQLSAYSQILHKLEQDANEMNAPSSSLILLDELGSGTDQDAGGAIAQAIVEHCMSFDGTRVVATTHCPRLKVLSFKDPNFSCASVLLSNPSTLDSTDHRTPKSPTYQLQYGIIGDSHALNAASRCMPELPTNVMLRATSLLSNDNEKASFYQTLEASMQKQLESAEIDRTHAAQIQSDAAQIQFLLKRVALSYERHFTLLEQRLDQCYQEAKKNPDAILLLGDVLSQVQVVKKQVKSQAEFLREQGLKLVRDDYTFSDGESVTIVAEGQWNGEMATVCIPSNDSKTSDSFWSTLGRDDVVVSPSLLPFSSDSMEMEEEGNKVNTPQMLIFKKSQLAIWDYESAFEEAASWNNGPSITSAPDSKRKLSSLLASLSDTKTKSPGDKRRVKTLDSQEGGSSSKFSSARERKAAKTKRKK